MLLHCAGSLIVKGFNLSQQIANLWGLRKMRLSLYDLSLYWASLLWFCIWALKLSLTLNIDSNHFTGKITFMTSVSLETYIKYRMFLVFFFLFVFFLPFTDHRASCVQPFDNLPLLPCGLVCLTWLDDTSWWETCKYILHWSTWLKYENLYKLPW